MRQARWWVGLVMFATVGCASQGTASLAQQSKQAAAQGDAEAGLAVQL